MRWVNIDSDFDGEHCLTVKEMNKEAVKCDGKCDGCFKRRKRINGAEAIGKVCWKEIVEHFLTL